MGSGYSNGRDQRNRVHQRVQPCRSCKAPMLWVTMPSGKRNPLDLEPTPAGNVMLVERDGGQLGPWRVGIVIHAGELLDEARALDVPLRTSHFATCPDAEDHRRPRPRKDIDG